MSKLIKSLLASSIAVGLSGCLLPEPESNSNTNNSNSAGNVTSDQAANITLSIDGGTAGLCTSLTPSNCDGYFSYASNNLYQVIPKERIAESAPPPTYEITVENIAALESSIVEGETWTQKNLDDLETIFESLLKTPFPGLSENVFDCTESPVEACSRNLYQVIADVAFDADGNRAIYDREIGDFPAGFEVELDGYAVWQALTDAEFDAMILALRVGKELPVPTYTATQEKVDLASDSDIVQASSAADDLVSLLQMTVSTEPKEKDQILSEMSALELRSAQVLTGTAGVGQSVYDAILASDGVDGEPWALYSGFHLGSQSKYILDQDSKDYVIAETYASDSEVADMFVVIDAVVAEAGLEFSYGEGGEFADRDAAYAALKAAFIAAKVEDVDGAAVFADQEAHYPDYPGEPDDLYSHLHVGSQSMYSVVQEDIDYLRGQSTASDTLLKRTIAVIKKMSETKTQYTYGADGEYADRGAAYAALAADFQATSVLESAFERVTGADVIATLYDEEEDALTAYLLDRPEVPKIEVAAVAASKTAHARQRFANLMRDTRRIGGENAKVGIFTANVSHPYIDYYAYATAFELEGFDVNWIPVSLASLDAQADMNDCANLQVEVGIDSGKAALEIDYPALHEQHLNACIDPSIVDTMLADLDVIYMAGGDQNDGFDALTETQRSAIASRHANGDLLLAGTSAGAAIHGETMFAGGSALEALNAGADVRDGLGTFDLGLVDTHTDSRGRVARIARALLDTNTRLGFGLNDGGSMEVREVSETEVQVIVNGNGLYLVDADSATLTGNTLADLTLHLLSDGDTVTIDPTDGSYTIELDASKNSSADAGFNLDAVSYMSDKDALGENRISKLVFNTYLDGYDDNPLMAETPAEEGVDPEFTMVLTRQASSEVVSNLQNEQSFTFFKLDFEEVVL